MKITRQSGVLLLVLVLSLTAAVGIAAADDLAGYEFVAANEYLSLYFNSETAEVAVHDLRTDLIWYSNPPNRASFEKTARGAAKDALGAQLRITYYEPGDVMRTMDSYNDSVAYGQFEAEPIANGIRVEYVFGKEWDDKYYLPLIVEQNLYETEFFAKLDAAQGRTISNLYALVELREPEEGQTANIAGKYVIHDLGGNLNARDQRIIHNVFLGHVVACRSDYTQGSQVKPEDLEAFLGKPFYMLKSLERDMLPWDKDAVIEITRDVGFDPHIIGEGYQQFNLEAGEPNIVVFKVPIEYRIDGENLVVNLDTTGIEYPLNVINREGNRVTYILTQIDLLPYFGAAEQGSDGYLFVPDGPGSLIYFDNGKTHLNPYTRRIFDQDHAVSAPSANVITHTNSLPVFGVKKDSRALFAIIEAGASIARLNADISGRRISYNTIFPSFIIFERTTSSLQGDMPDIHRASAQWVQSGQSSVNVYQPKMYDQDIQIRYAFLVDDQADYVGMAHYYQNYLLAKGFLTRIDPQPQVPLMLELIGAIQNRRPILGVPRDVIVPLTTFAEAQAFVSQLFDKGIKNLSVTYTGWMSNGVSHRYPSKAKLESKLGTKAELTELNRMLADSGGRLYPAVNFQHIKYDTMLDGFISMRDGTRALTRTVATGIDRITGMPYYILSPAKLDSLVSRYLVSQQQYEFSGIHLADLASRLYGDYRRGHVVIREEAIRIIEQQLAKIKGEYGLEIQSYGINSYAIPYVSSVINLPLHHTGIDITDETVPFVPIVLHGFVHYAGEPLNRIGDYGDYLLKMVEVGAYPFFQAFNANPSILKGSLYADYYTGEFKTITDYIVDVYNELNGVFINLQNERIIDHQKLQDRVYATVYENGVRIVVNYDLEPVTIDGYRIEPKSYRVFEGE